MSETGHESAERFSGRVATYERYRSPFPPNLLDRLNTVCGLTPTQVIGDIGAGTGMLAELFLRNGNPVFAVEPNDEMRARCEQLRTRYPRLEVSNGTTESTTLPSASVEVIAVGRAFHWFDRPRAIAEFARVLRPGGSVVLVTSKWSGDGSAASVDFEELLKSECVDYRRVLDAQLTREEMDELFTPESLAVEDLHSEETLSFGELAGRAESLSVTPAPRDPNYGTFRNALEAYFARHARQDRVHTVSSYRLICGRLS